MRKLIELRQLHDIINQTQQIVRLVIDFLQEALGILRLHQAAEHNFRIAQYRLQRCFQLMRNVGRKLTADFFRGSAFRYIHNQQHKAFISDSAAIELVIAAAAVDYNASLALLLNLGKKSPNFVAVINHVKALAQKLLLFLAEEFRNAFIDRFDFPHGIKEHHAFIHIIGYGLQLLLFIFIAAHFLLQLFLLQLKILHNRLQLRVNYRLRIRLLQIEIFQRPQNPCGNSFCCPEGTAQNYQCQQHKVTQNYFILLKNSLIRARQAQHIAVRQAHSIVQNILADGFGCTLATAFAACQCLLHLLALQMILHRYGISIIIVQSVTVRCNQRYAVGKLQTLQLTHRYIALTVDHDQQVSLTLKAGEAVLGNILAGKPEEEQQNKAYSCPCQQQYAAEKPLLHFTAAIL